MAQEAPNDGIVFQNFQKILESNPRPETEGDSVGQKVLSLGVGQRAGF